MCFHPFSMILCPIFLKELYCSAPTLVIKILHKLPVQDGTNSNADAFASMHPNLINFLVFSRTFEILGMSPLLPIKAG
jgi:hypothetical protein